MAQHLSNLVAMFEASVARHGERNLFGVRREATWQWMTYGEFAALVDEVRGGLAALGVRRGDRVAIVADNRVEWAAACYATNGLGATFVPMYEAELAREWEFILADCGARVAIGATRLIVDVLTEMKGRVPTLEHVVDLEGTAADAGSFEHLREHGRARPVPSVQPESDELAGLIYTSGTTGLPKGVMLTHRNICSNIEAIHESFAFEGAERSLAFLPWAHSFGQTCELHGLLSFGGEIAINDTIPNLVGNLAEVKPTVLFAVPRIFNRLYEGVHKQIASKPAMVQSLVRAGIDAATRKGRGANLGLLDQLVLWLADRLAFATIRERFGGRLKYAISGSAALSCEVAEFIDALGIMVYEGYGLTETSPIATANFPGNRRMGSVGRAVPGVRIEIDTAVSGDPRDGEIVVHGPNVMRGYFNRADETAQVLRADGALRTGDLGHLDADGFLWITGRIKEQYKLENGKYVVPSPLEEKIKLSPFIANVLVHGANRPYNVALVVPERAAIEEWARGQGLTLGDFTTDPRLRQLLHEELARTLGPAKGFERIEKFAIAEQDFTTENGMLTPTLKLKRRAVLERYGADLEALYARGGASA